jgi:futalosine hydrolase
MKLLFVTSTPIEVEPLLNHLNLPLKNEFIEIANSIDLLITGAGTPNTVFKLTRHLNNNKYDGIINLGIAGSFNKNLKLTDVFEVAFDEFADLGYEENGQFYTLENLDFFEESDRKFSADFDLNFKLPKVKGITVNTVSADLLTINQLIIQFNPDIESMEGAAVGLTAKKLNIPFTQIRAVSNYIGERDKSKWELEKAVKALNQFIIHHFKLKK